MQRKKVEHVLSLMFLRLRRLATVEDAAKYFAVFSHPVSSMETLNFAIVSSLEWIPSHLESKKLVAKKLFSILTTLFRFLLSNT